MLKRVLKVFFRLARYRRLKKNGVVVDSTSVVDKKTTFEGFNKIYARVRVTDSRIGKATYIAEGSSVSYSVIGSFCSIGPDVRIGLGIHPVGWISTHPAFYSNAGQTTVHFSKGEHFTENKRVEIGCDVWIGAAALILDGVRIGHGAIVAAGSVVTKDVPPYAIVAGVPAKIIRMRFSEEVICELIEWRWWDLEMDAIGLLSTAFDANGRWVVNDLKKILPP